LALYPEAGPRLEILLSRTIEDISAGNYEAEIFEKFKGIIVEFLLEQT
jgi:hypothetical protein